VSAGASDKTFAEKGSNNAGDAMVRAEPCAAGFLTGNRLILILLVLITAQGAVLRFSFLGHQSLWIDEAVSVTHARGILEKGYPLLPDGHVSWDSIPAHYLLAAGMMIFEDVHLGARFFPALAGVLSIPIFYMLNLLVFRKRPQALLAAALLAMLTIDVAWSRQARAYAFVQLFEISGLTMFYRFLDVPKARTFWTGAALLVLAVLCHPAAVWAAVAAVVAFSLPPREIPQRIAAVLPWPRLRPLFLVAVVAGVLVALKTSYHGAALQLLRSTSPGVGRWDMMYAGFLVVELGLFSVLFIVGVATALFSRARYASALAAGAFTYAVFISFRTPLFAFRYLMPVLPAVVAFAANAVTLPLVMCICAPTSPRARSTRRARDRVGARPTR
jgi:4-amino-4-deoxy-L-arabinose transferase-like glycosyltransferase